MTERRAIVHELRAKGRRLEGYAATFGTEARIGGGLVETIAPGAFGVSLRSGRDVLALDRQITTPPASSPAPVPAHCDCPRTPTASPSTSTYPTRKRAATCWRWRSAAT